MIGETIGNFKVVSRLGRGGMGEVYAGEHEKIQTRVAIKVLHAEVSSDADHVQRFFNEAKIVGRIKHAGIVKIFDVGFVQEHAYLVMELLEGESLSSRIDKAERLSAKDTAEIGKQIASVLDATHRAGVIHRDLKPDNIFVVPDHELDGGERVKVLDFGISKLSGTMASNSPRTVGTMGTPQYMAPEQWGDSGQVDWRADVYSLGCVLFEMAAGRPPFEVKTIAEACAKHLHAKPPAPRSLVPDLPVALDELILRLLAKDPNERAVSMGQVARELEAIAEGREPEAEIPQRRESRPAWTKTPETLTTLSGSASEVDDARKPNRTPLIIGIAAAVAVLGVFVAVMMSRPKDEPVKPAASAPVLVPAAQPAAPPPDAAPPLDAAPIDAPAPPPPDAAAPPPVIKPPVHKKPPKLPPTGAGSGSAQPATVEPEGWGGRR